MKSLKWMLPCAGFFCVQQALAEDEWQHTIEPYIQFTSIEGDATVGRASGVDVDVDFGDILEVLKIGAMIHFESIHRSGFGYQLDYGFMDLRDDIDSPLGGIAELKVRQAVFDVTGMYRNTFDGGSLDYLLGIRWWDNDIEGLLSGGLLPGSLQLDVAEDWIDVYLGMRWQRDINRHWGYFVKGDVGGFGLEADFTANAHIGGVYKFNKEMALTFAYKSTWVDYRSSTKQGVGTFLYDTSTHGPVVSFRYHF